MKYLFIDIRKSDEVYSKHFDENHKQDYYNIPMNMIRFNSKTIIKHLEYFDEIYIICQSGNRSRFIKEKYFQDNNKIKVDDELQFANFKIGKNVVELNGESIVISISGKDSFNLYSITRILQLFLGILIILIGGYTLLHIKNKKINMIPLIILVIMGINAFYNSLTSTCTITSLLRDYLN